MTEPEAEAQATAERAGRLLAERDRFAQLLGIRLEAASPGYARVSMVVRGDHLNGVGSTHGGATFALADFAFAVAANSHGRIAVALSAQISYPAASTEGDRLTAEACEESLGGRTGLYRVEVRRADGELTGLFTGTVYRTRTPVGDAPESDPGG